jgi:hypothetical protein
MGFMASVFLKGERMTKSEAIDVLQRRRRWLRIRIMEREDNGEGDRTSFDYAEVGALDMAIRALERSAERRLEVRGVIRD